MWGESSPFTCLHCSEQSKVFAVEWPPKMVACAGCGSVMRLLAYDPKSQTSSYRIVTTD